jgi:hypothetical protein
MLLARKSQRTRSVNRVDGDEMWIGTKGDTKEEEIRGKGVRRPSQGESWKGTPSSKHVPCRSHRDASDAVLPQPVATVRPVPLTPPNILLNFHRRLCLFPPSSSYNSSLLHLSRSFSHPPALRGVFSSPFRFFDSFDPLTLLHSPRFRFRL